MSDTETYMTATQFANKVHWEGGVMKALEYGLKHTHLHPDDLESAPLRAAWLVLETIWRKEFQPALRRAEEAIEDLDYEE